MQKQRIRIEQQSGLGLFWFAGWLFSIGYLELSFWKGVVAIIVWPFFSGRKSLDCRTHQCNCLRQTKGHL